jgi:type I restriction enzyme S subunit
VNQLVTDNLDIWTAAIETRSAAGRGSSSKFKLYGIKKLRELILELAVRGLLVSQDPNDEPASVLLEKIAAEKERLVKEKIIKKQNPLSPINEDEMPFDLPQGWEWVRINEILKGDTQNGLSTKANEELDGVPLLRISAGTVREDFVVDEDEFKLTNNLKEDAKVKYALEAGDLLAVRFNGNKSFVGRLSIFENHKNEVQVYPDKLIRIRLFKEFTNPYLIRIFFNSKPIRQIIENYCATTVGNWGVSATNLKTILLPIPPEAEQTRIVAKFDEIIALCDSVKSRINNSQTTQLHLADAMSDRVTTENLFVEETA